MKNSVDIKYKDYVGSVEVSVEDECLHGKILFINDLITYEGQTISELRTAFQEAVDRYLEYCKKTNTPPNKPYSGSFNVRIGPELHMQAAKCASRTGKNLNEFVKKAVQDAIAPKENNVQIHQHNHKHSIHIETHSASVSMSDSTGWIHPQNQNQISRH